jgi:hypothetical protein
MGRAKGRSCLACQPTYSVSGQHLCLECGRVWGLERVQGRLCLPLCGLAGPQFADSEQVGALSRRKSRCRGRRALHDGATSAQGLSTIEGCSVIASLTISDDQLER